MELAQCGLRGAEQRVGNVEPRRRRLDAVLFERDPLGLEWAAGEQRLERSKLADPQKPALPMPTTPGE